MSKKLNILIDEYELMKQKFQEQAKGLFKEYVKEVFEQIPELKVIKWTQYTPYFNDGDTCEFSVHSPTFSNADPDELNKWGEYEGEDEKVWALDGSYQIQYIENEELRKQLEKYGTIIDEFGAMITSSAMEDIFYGMFGDHSVVTVTKDEISVDDCDHD